MQSNHFQVLSFALKSFQNNFLLLIKDNLFKHFLWKYANKFVCYKKQYFKFKCKIYFYNIAFQITKKRVNNHICLYKKQIWICSSAVSLHFRFSSFSKPAFQTNKPSNSALATFSAESVKREFAFTYIPVILLSFSAVLSRHLLSIHGSRSSGSGRFLIQSHRLLLLLLL